MGERELFLLFHKWVAMSSKKEWAKRVRLIWLRSVRWGTLRSSWCGDSSMGSISLSTQRSSDLWWEEILITQKIVVEYFGSPTQLQRHIDSKTHNRWVGHLGFAHLGEHALTKDGWLSQNLHQCTYHKYTPFCKPSCSRSWLMQHIH